MVLQFECPRIVSAHRKEANPFPPFPNTGSGVAPLPRLHVREPEERPTARGRERGELMEERKFSRSRAAGELVFIFIFRRCSFNAIPYITDIHFLISQTRRRKTGRGHAQNSQSNILFYVLMMVVGFFGQFRDGLLFSLIDFLLALLLPPLS